MTARELKYDISTIECYEIQDEFSEFISKKYSDTFLMQVGLHYKTVLNAESPPQDADFMDETFM